MASKVVTYHVPSDSAPPPPPPAVGVTKALEAPEDIPFLLGPSIPNWEDGGTVTALQTNLFMAPAVAHAPSRPGYTTFLLIRKAAKEEEAAKPEEAKRFTIREAPPPLAPPTAAHAQRPRLTFLPTSPPAPAPPPPSTPLFVRAQKDSATAAPLDAPPLAPRARRRRLPCCSWASSSLSSPTAR